jgi:putative ABC transport system permease protein
MLKLAWKNIKSKRLSSGLTLLLFATGISVISAALLMSSQVASEFKRNLVDIDMVVGAKGSPMQLILSSVYHVDFPTGNISEADANLISNHHMVEAVVPLALGDNYKDFRIVGTTHDYVTMYSASVAEGVIWDNDLDVVLGHAVVRETGLKIGDEFNGAHGLGNSIHSHDEHNYKVVGILAPSGSVLDQLILTNVSSIWKVHDKPEEVEHDHDHNHDDDEFDAEDLEGVELIEDEPKTPSAHEITALLVMFKAPMAHLSVPRWVNESTNMQSASPVFESARLYKLIEPGIDALEYLAMFIILISALSIFISLLQSLKDRKYEIALLRVMGGSRTTVFSVVLLEGLILSLIGALLGLLLSHVGVSVMAGFLRGTYHYSFSGLVFVWEELVLLAVALLIGLLSALIPAILASKTDISTTLSKA